MGQIDDIRDDFTGPLDPRWRRTLTGGGTLALADSALRLALPGAVAGRYADAQIDDYTGLRLARFPWRPPLRMEVRARMSHPICPPSARPDGDHENHEQQRYLRGTVGFGFWNYPLTLGGGIPRLPDAVWFFGASPPSNMALIPGMPGRGWKAQVVHAHCWRALLTGGPTLTSIAWARVSGREATAARWVRRLTGASEALLTLDTTGWHDYALEWRRDIARFWIDGVETLAVPDPPGGPLGFVAWIDNQYAIATPRGRLSFGALASAAEWLELDRLLIHPL